MTVLPAAEEGRGRAQEFDPSYEAVLGSYAACFHDDVGRELKDESGFPFNALTMR